MRGGKAFPKVLLVSGDSQLRHQLRDHLSALGLSARALVSARTVPACLTAVSQTRPRLLIFDDGIATQNPRDLFRIVRQCNPEVLVVYLATHHTAELERAVRQLGVLYYTEKPPDPQLFGKILSSALVSTVNPLSEGRATAETGELSWRAPIRRPTDT